MKLSPKDMRAIRAVATVASPDKARPILCGVRIQPRDGGSTIVATDSYRLAWMDIDEPTDMEIIVGPDQVKAMKAISGPKAELPATIEMVPDVSALTWLGGSCEDDGFYDGMFPDWRQLVPSKFPDSLTQSDVNGVAAFNPFYLAGLATAAKVLLIDNTTSVRVFFTDARRPAYFRIVSHEAGTFNYLLMPVRVQ
jgi:DNA polymerase III sliding clamp (beta) subunit (PCNA family)